MGSWTGVKSNSKKAMKRKHSTCTSLLHASSTKVTTPSPEEAAAMGARDWPQQIKKGSWIEEIPTDEVKVRYILDGEGILDIANASDDMIESKRSTLRPGTLIEATGPLKLKWKVTGEGGNDEMIILTPGYEQKGLLLVVAGIFLILCVSLVAFS